MLLSSVWTIFQDFLEARAKNVKNFVGFLGHEKTRLLAFEIYWPLVCTSIHFILFKFSIQLKAESLAKFTTNLAKLVQLGNPNLQIHSSLVHSLYKNQSDTELLYNNRYNSLFHLLFTEIFLYYGAQKFLYWGLTTEISVPHSTENFCEK